MSEEGSFLKHQPCPDCGSSDALAVYTDHTFCFACSTHTNAASDGAKSPRRPKMAGSLLTGEVRALAKRKLSADACRKFGVRVTTYQNQPALTMDYVDTSTGQVVAQKVRTGDKEFTVLGDLKKAGLFGQHLWPAKGRRVVVTEGELDAVALCQADGLKWPTVSIPNGAQGARKALSAAREWLEGYDEVVLAFDADEAGRKAAADAASALTPGKVRIADFGPFGFKDANEAVMRAETEHDPDFIRNLLKAIWDARPWRPAGVVSLSDIREKAKKKLLPGTPWPWPGLTAITKGRRLGEIIAIGAGTGVGKTDFLTQTMAHDVTLGIKCGVLSFEQPVGQTGRRIAGKLSRKRFHVIDGSWTDAEYDAAWDALEATDAVFLYDSFGVTDWKTVKAMILYMVEVLGCLHVFLDNFTAIVAGEADENAALKVIMGDLAQMAQGRFTLHAVSHLSRPEGGKSHEEGARVALRHFRGSHTIAMGSNFCLGLERDKTADDPEDRARMTVRCLKDRDTGDGDGMTIDLIYDRDTGMMNEADHFEEAAPASRRVSAQQAGF